MSKKSTALHNENSITAHMKNNSFELGINSLGRLYGKYIYSTGDGYVYNRLSINLPEIIGMAVLVTYAPGVVGGASAAGASIQIFK